MGEYLTAAWFANHIRMMRIQDTRTFLIVEGFTDQHFYQFLLDSEKKYCLVINADNKKNAIDAIKHLEQTEFTGILAIVDADFDVLKQTVPGSDNVLLTDTHDLETMILKSPAFDKFLGAYGSQKKIDEFVKQHRKEVRQKLLEEGLHLGYLRWVSLDDLDEGHKLKFEGLSFSKFLDKKTLTINPNKLIQTVKNHSQQHSLDENDLQKQVNNKKDQAHDPWHVCCGHDLVVLLSEGLRFSLGSTNPNEVKPEYLEKNLRLAYEYNYFASTQLYQSIKSWEQANSPFKIISIRGLPT